MKPDGFILLNVYTVHVKIMKCQNV